MNEIVYSNIQAKSGCTYECLGAGIWQLSDNYCPNSSDCADTLPDPCTYGIPSINVDCASA